MNDKEGSMLKKINYVLDRKQKTNLIILLLVIFIDAFAERSVYNKHNLIRYLEKERSN